jgi:hypothetical protein
MSARKDHLVSPDRHHRSNKIVAAHVVTTMLSGHDLLRMVAAAFDCDVPTYKSGIRSAQEFFDHPPRGTPRPADRGRAQNLNEGALEDSHVVELPGPECGSLPELVGQPQFRRIIANPDLEQLRQRVVASYHLGPLNSLRPAITCSTASSRSAGPATSLPIARSRHSSAHQRHSAPHQPMGNRLMILGYLDELHAFRRTMSIASRRPGQ